MGAYGGVKEGIKPPFLGQDCLSQGRGLAFFEDLALEEAVLRVTGGAGLQLHMWRGYRWEGGRCTGGAGDSRNTQGVR